MDEFSSAYAYGLRTPSPRRASAATSPDLGQTDFEPVRRLFPQELPQLPSYPKPPNLSSGAACSSQQRANSTVEDNRAPLQQLECYQYSDRLIPSRAASNLESGLGLLDVENSQHEMANSSSSQSSQMAVTVTTPRGSARDELQHRNESGATFERLLRDQLLGLASPQPKRVTGCERTEEEFLKTPERRDGLFRYKCQSEDDPGPLSSSPLRTVSTCSATPPRLARKIPAAPYKVLHAPKLEDDFYLNLLDFSSEDILAVGIGSCVDLWSARAGRAARLCNLGETTKISSVRWTKGHFHRSSDLLAVGTSDGKVQIWDVVASRKLHTLAGHSRRTCALAWADDSSLFTGAQDRHILRWDLRQAVSGNGLLSNPAQRLRSHTEEVCALSWSQEWQQLASGGNEGKVLLWSGRTPFPELDLGGHAAAVKALAWSPCNRGVLASGGGTADKSIRLWNTLTGTQGTRVETESQVCNLAWSPAGDGELLSTHGYSTNQLALWRYQSGGGLSQIHSLKWHKSRVLYLTVSSDGQTVVTGDGNETLCFWNILARCKARVSTPGSSSSLSISEASSLSRTIR